MITADNYYKHLELVKKFESATILMNQLVNGKYSSFDVYHNNVNHLGSELKSASSLIFNDAKGNDNSFEVYLLDNDSALYYNLQALLLAIQMLKNMLDNIVDTLMSSKIH